MKFEINKDMLPMKGHFFLFNAGTAPLVPYLSSYARQIGFSSYVVGIIYTFLPISGLIAKPLFGAIADRFQKQKLLFITFQIVTLLSFLAIYFVPAEKTTVTVELACGDGDTFLNACFTNETAKDLCAANRVIAEKQVAQCQMSCAIANPMMWETICLHWDIPDYCYSNRQSINFTTKINRSVTYIEESCINLKTHEVLLQNGNLSYTPNCYARPDLPYPDAKCTFNCKDERINALINNTPVELVCRENNTHFSICQGNNETRSEFLNQMQKETEEILCDATCAMTEPYKWMEICSGWKADDALECMPTRSDGSRFPLSLDFTGIIPLEKSIAMNNCVYFKLQEAVLPNGPKTYYANCPTHLSHGVSRPHFHSACSISCDNILMSEMLSSMKNVEDDKDSSSMYKAQFWFFFTFMIISWVGQAVVVSVGDAICFYMLGNKPSAYGRQRLWGSVGWGIFSLLTGILIDEFSRGSGTKDYTVAFVLMAIFIALDIVVSLFLKYQTSNVSGNMVRDMGLLLSSPHTLVFLVWTIAVGICTGLQWQFLFWYIEDLADSYGCSTSSWTKTIQGLVSAIQCFAGEIPFMFLSGTILKRIGHLHTMSFVLFAFGIRFILYSLLTNPWWILPVEMFQGLTFGMFYPTMASYASVVAPPGTEATVQGLVGAVFEGIGTSVGSFIGGAIYTQQGGSNTFRWFGIGALIACLLHAVGQWAMGRYLHSTKREQEDFSSIIRYATPNDAIQMLHEIDT